MLLPRTLLANLFAVFLIGGMSSLAQTAEPPQPAEGPIAAAAPSMAKILNNGSIIRMVGAGLSDDLVLQAIASQPGQYTTDADSLVDLKDAGVSERVISAMMNKGRKRLTPEGNTAEDPPPAPISEVSEIGAYYKDRNGAWQPLGPKSSTSSPAAGSNPPQPTASSAKTVTAISKDANRSLRSRLLSRFLSTHPPASISPSTTSSASASIQITASFA